MSGQSWDRNLLFLAFVGNLVSSGRVKYSHTVQPYQNRGYVRNTHAFLRAI